MDDQLGVIENGIDAVKATSVSRATSCPVTGGSLAAALALNTNKEGVHYFILFHSGRDCKLLVPHPFYKQRKELPSSFLKDMTMHLFFLIYAILLQRHFLF